MTIPVPGDAVSPGVVPKPNNDMGDLVRRLEARIAELERRTLYSAYLSAGDIEVQNGGRFTIRNPTNGNKIFYAGPSDEGFYFVAHYRDDGTLMLGTWYRFSDLEQALTWTDRSGVPVVQDDFDGIGLNRPWIPVPGSHQYNPVGAAGTVRAYRSLPVASLSGETELWEGRASVAHPMIAVQGVWGSATGSGTYTYRLYVAGELLGSWSTTGTEIRESLEGPFQIVSFIHYDWSKVVITCQAAGGATGNVACEVRGAYFRGVPT